MDEIELIKQKINIVDLIQEYLPLKKTGINFKANCPFHEEKTPSFVVSPERGIWHCFGCSKGGDIFKFLMEKENMTFPESLALLAQKAGVVLSKKNQEKRSEDVLFELHEKASQLFHYFLIEHRIGKKALAYLYERGLTEDTVKQFKLGYSPNNWQTLTAFLKKRGYKDDDLMRSGLCVPSKSGCYDRFRGRIMFPLIDTKGQIIGFAGRVLGQGESSKMNLAEGGPKYVNSPKTPIFDKSNFLFGLNFSKNDIRQKNEAILVEGEMDMILSYQTGTKNIAASKGTALTEGQIELIKKHANTISLSFDADLAGDSAIRRGIEIADKKGLNIKVVRIKDAKDAGELCIKDPKSWAISVEEAIPIYDYYIESSSARFNPRSAQGKKEILGELLPILDKITDSMVEEHYIQKLAATLSVKDDLIRAEIDKQKAVNPKLSYAKESEKSRQDGEIRPKDRRRLLEEYLIALMLHVPQNHSFIPNFPETLFTEESLRHIYVLLVLYMDGIYFKSQSFKIEEFVETLPQEAVEQVDVLYLKEIDEKLISGVYWQKEVDFVVLELKKCLIKASLEKLSLEIKNAQSFDKIEALSSLNKRFRDLSIKLKNA